MIFKRKLRHIPVTGLKNVMFIIDNNIKRNMNIDGITKLPSSKRCAIYHDYDVVKRLAETFKVDDFRKITVKHLAEHNYLDKRIMNNIFFRYFNPDLLTDLLTIKLGVKPKGINPRYIRRVKTTLKKYSDSAYLKKYSTSSNCISLYKTLNEKNLDPIRTAEAIRQILVDINEGNFTYDTLFDALGGKNKHTRSLYDKIMENIHFYLNVKKYIKDFNTYGYFIHDGVKYMNSHDFDIPIYIPLISLLKPNKSGYILNEELELVKANKE